jgi:hypothetical protein
MISLRVAAAGIAAAVVLCVPALQAQQELPLAPVPPRGQTVSPFFEGWYLNPDGSYTLSFGYFNRNSEEVVEIPLGEDNFIEPRQFDGDQPTSFPPRRERGVFAVTIPAEFAGQDIVWTLRNRGQTFSVPGRVTSPAYELGYLPMAAGSVPPAIRFDPEGRSERGIIGITSTQTLTTRVGEPLSISIWFDDLASVRDPVPLNVAWFKHTGPGEVTFEPRTLRDVEDGTATVTATFSAPGEYLVRGRVDNHASNDSSPGDQCCWSNAYQPVVVTP